MDPNHLIFIFFLAVGFGISIVLIIRILGSPSTHGRTSLIVLIIAVALWIFGYAMELVSVSLDEKLIWKKIQFTAIPFVVPGIFWFTVDLSGGRGWLTLTKRLLLGIIPFLCVLLALSNDQVGLIWTTASLESNQDVSPLKLQYGIGLYIILIYSYVLIVTSAFFLTKTIIKSKKLFRNQAIIMLIGILLPWAANLAYVTRLIPLFGLDITPFMLTFTNFIFLIGFLKVRLSDILPIAQDFIFKSMTEGVVVLDYKEQIVEINPVAIKLFEQSDDYIGNRFTELLPEWERYNPSRDKYIQEITIRNQDYNLRTDPILNQRNKLTGYLVIFTNVTEFNRKEKQIHDAHKQAIEANRLKTQLLANVNHDLRTPLSTIMGYAEMLHTGSFGPLSLEQENATVEILDSTNKLLVFINNIIGQAQFETGRIVIKERKFIPDELIEGIRSTVQYLAKKKNLSLSFDIDPGVPDKIIGDPYWLKQILLNLVNNALKFTDHGAVNVNIYLADQDHWSMRVRDTGIGIPIEAQNRIFEAFQQIDTKAPVITSGSGLGLSIVSELVSLMKGTINLESEVGKGSVFTVCLPLITEHE